MPDDLNNPQTGLNAGSRPPTVEYAAVRDRADALWSWVVRTFTSENVLSGLRTLAWVGPLTILIWVYAEREQVLVKPGATIPITVKSTDPTRIVRLRPGEQSVTADIVGPKSATERVYELLRRPGDEPALQIDIDGRFPAGRWSTIETAQYVADNPIFKSAGVTVRDCKPRTLNILVLEITEREVEVQAPAELTNLAAPAIFEPRTVKVRGPKSVLDDPNERLVVRADLVSRAELATPGTHELAAVRLVCSIDDPAITILPSTVKAIIEVNQSDVRYRIDSMPIHIAASPLILSKSIEMPATIANIWVIGPPEKIELLKRDAFRPKARLELSLDDVGKGQITRELLFDLPEGVKVTSEDRAAGKCAVSFKVTAPSE